MVNFVRFFLEWKGLFYKVNLIYDVLFGKINFFFIFIVVFICEGCDIFI